MKFTLSILLTIILCISLLLQLPRIVNINALTTETENSEKYRQVPIIRFSVRNISPNKSDIVFTDWWYSEWEDCYYLFLPCVADRSNLCIVYETETGESVYLNNIPVHSEQKTDILGLSDEFDITVGGNNYGRLKILQSELGSMFINTSGDGIEALEKNKNLTETGKAIIFNSNGKVEYNGNIEKISGHGNSSWDYSKKKSYNIKLPKKADLFGMGKAKKWMLISNALDQSLLRNNISIEMSRNAGMDCVLDSAYIDLYADGLYRGTYQLYERIEIEKNRVDISDLEKKTEDVNDKELDQYETVVINADSPNEYIENSCKYFDIPNNPKDITGGYLLEFQMCNRYGSRSSSGLVTKKGQAIEITSPEFTSKAQMSYIREFMQDLEDAIYSDSGYNSKGRHYSSYIDVDSLIKAYLVQEITMNIDGTFASFYMWKDSDRKGDGKLHFGPAWDFDLAYGNFHTYYNNGDGKTSYAYKPDNLFVANFPISGYKLHDGDEGSGRPTYGISWVGQLYKRHDFLKRVAEIYFDNYEEYIHKMCNPYDNSKSLISISADNIRKSAEMNSARWHTFGNHPLKYSNGDTFDKCVEFVSDFLSKRQQYLSELWKPLLGQDIRGDLNGDGSINSVDVQFLKKYILSCKFDLISVSFADMNEDGMINVFDFIRLKSILLKNTPV